MNNFICYFLKNKETLPLSQFEPSLKQKVIKLQLALLLLFMPVGAYVDGEAFAAYWGAVQWLPNVLVSIFTAWIYYISDKKLRRKMIIMLICSTIGEYFGTFIFKLYTYRLHNIPIYVPIAHTTFFATVYHLHKWTIIRQHSRLLTSGLYGLITLLCSLFLVLYGDISGLLGYLLIVAILYKKKSKLPYLFVALLGLYAERCGTYTQAWRWSAEIGIAPYTVPIGNPPIGVMGLYILIDFITNIVYFWFYLMRHVQTENGVYSHRARRILQIKRRYKQYIEQIDLILVVFFGFGHQPCAVFGLCMMINFLKTSVYLRSHNVRRKRLNHETPSENGPRLKHQVIVLINQFLVFIDLLLVAMFERWGYQSFVKRTPSASDEKAMTMPYHSDDVLHHIATLRTSFLHSLDDIERQIKEKQRLIRYQQVDEAGVQD